jgi:hypothetical protein
MFNINGVEYVICIERSEKLMDKAAITFSRVFYGEIFTCPRTVEEGFNIAKESVRKDHGEFEASKFKIFKPDDFSMIPSSFATDNTLISSHL